MDTNELQKKLNLLGVNPQEYSLIGELQTDSIILYQSYQKWEVFYLDDRGNRNDEKVFDTESEACNYIYQKFKEAKEIEKNISSQF